MLHRWIITFHLIQMEIPTLDHAETVWLNVKINLNGMDLFINN